MRHEVTAASVAPHRSAGLISDLRLLLGRRNVLTGRAATARYLAGYREGRGAAVAVIRPGSLLELWHAFKACVAADHIVIAQAANTGLTGGSAPWGSYDRPVVVINTMRLSAVVPIRQARQVVCLAGTTLHDLAAKLAPLGREPHSVIGSSCLGASVVGGVCNNSGGALVSRGPAYTRLALFARVAEDGTVSLCNHLGIDLGTDPEDILKRLERGAFDEADVCADDEPASARDYAERVRACDENTPARYNNDPTRLFETSGCAGKLVVFAVRLDTFPIEVGAATYYIGTDRTDVLTTVRRRLLTECEALPIAAEYIHRDAFGLAAEYGKDTVLAIRWLGTGRLPALFALKARIDGLAGRLGFRPSNLSDRLLQAAARYFPDYLPGRLRTLGETWQHQLLLKVPASEANRVTGLLDQCLAGDGEMIECTAHEAELAFLHRFAVAGAAVRYRAIHSDKVADILALDIALRRNDVDWFEVLPDDLSSQMLGKLYYGHFLCHVFHQDYLIATGGDPAAIKDRLLALLTARGAEYPAEHNVGHLYHAKPPLAAHYRALDPRNQLNPVLGKTSKRRDWA